MPTRAPGCLQAAVSHRSSALGAGIPARAVSVGRGCCSSSVGSVSMRSSMALPGEYGPGVRKVASKGKPELVADDDWNAALHDRVVKPLAGCRVSTGNGVEDCLAHVENVRRPVSLVC
eukprot:scaffold62324_cov66-Phaeocystis_antarctica.AAC.3